MTHINNINLNFIEWTLRIGLFATFVGHGAFALQGKESWITWIVTFTGFDISFATQVLLLIGALDIVVGLVILVKPIRIVLLWVILWTSWTAIMRVLPFIGDPIWELLEKLINPAAAISLLLIRGLPIEIKRVKEWFR